MLLKRRRRLLIRRLAQLPLRCCRWRRGCCIGLLRRRRFLDCWSVSLLRRCLQRRSLLRRRRPPSVASIQQHRASRSVHHHPACGRAGQGRGCGRAGARGGEGGGCDRAGGERRCLAGRTVQCRGKSATDRATPRRRTLPTPLSSDVEAGNCCVTHARRIPRGHQPEASLPTKQPQQQGMLPQGA